MKIMKLTQLANGKDRWVPCKRKDLKENDCYYEIEDGCQSEVMIAISDAKRELNPENNIQWMWTIDSTPFSNAMEVLDRALAQLQDLDADLIAEAAALELKLA